MPQVSTLRSLPTGLRWAGCAALIVLIAAVTMGADGKRVPLSSTSVCSSMSDAQLIALSTAIYSRRPATVSATPSSAQAVVATYNVTNYQFNADNNAGTQVDVVHILAGQSVQFHWVAGIHTTTSGTYYDPDFGSIWDAPMDSAHPNYIVTFNTPGTYPFFCQLHGEYNNMVGTIVVDASTPTHKSTWGAVKVRYR